MNNNAHSNLNAKTGKPKISSRGGARPGSGRKKGVSSRITLEALMKSIDLQLGHSYADQIAINYREAMLRGDYAGVRDYDKVLLGKLVADRQAVEVTDVNAEDTVELKRQAFAEAVQALSNSKVAAIATPKTGTKD